MQFVHHFLSTLVSEIKIKNKKKPVAWSFLRDLTRNRQENNFAWPYEFGNAFAIGSMIDFHLGLTGTCI